MTMAVETPAPVMVQIRCKNCGHRLLDVQKEHEAMVRLRIQIRCVRCRTDQ